MFEYFVKKQQNDALCFAKTGLILLVYLLVLLVDCILQKQSYKLNTTATSVVSRSIPHQAVIRIFVVWMVLLRYTTNAVSTMCSHQYAA